MKIDGLDMADNIVMNGWFNNILSMHLYLHSGDILFKFKWNYIQRFFGFIQSLPYFP